MKTFHDTTLRKALYEIYLAQYHAISTCPEHFAPALRTKMLDGLMGARPWSWRVIGVTKDALEQFEKNRFKTGKGVQRGHLVNRAVTAGLIYDTSRGAPMPLDQLFDLIKENDRTVLMTTNENLSKRYRNDLPEYIRINRRRRLFPSNPTVGYFFASREMELMRRLHARYIAAPGNGQRD